MATKDMSPETAELQATPRFSLNKLAEYLVAGAGRRRTLILQQMRVSPVRASRYNRARRVLQRFLCDPAASVESLGVEAARLRDRAATSGITEFEHACLVDSARAVEAFVQIADEFRYEGVVLVPGAPRHRSLTIRRVRVSVLPDVCILDPNTESQVGALKLHMARTHQLNAEALKYAAALVCRFVERARGVPRRDLCEVVDVFGGTYQNAPRAVKRRLKDVRAACEEIAERWPTLLRVALRDRTV